MPVIVAEVASWGKDKLVADGLGAYIAEVTEKGDQPAIYFQYHGHGDLRRRDQPHCLASSL